MKRFKLYFALSLLAIISLTCGAYATNNFIKNSLDDVEQIPLHEQYKAIINCESLAEQYQSIEKTEAGLSLYAATINEVNSALERSNVEDLITTITFNNYLSFFDLATFINQYSLKTVQVQLRAFDNETGAPLTIFTRTDLGIPETEKFLIQQSIEGNYT